MNGPDEAVLATLNTMVNVNCDAERPNLMIQSMVFSPTDPVAYLPLTMTMKIIALSIKKAVIQ